MRMRSWAIGLVFGTAIAGGAQAGDASCLWNVVSRSSRDAVIKDYAVRGAATLNENTFSEAELQQALTECHVEEKNVGIAGEALAAYTLEQASALWLDAHGGPTLQKLSTNWDRLPPETRADFTAWVLKVAEAPGTDVPLPEKALDAIFQALELPKFAPHVTVYYSARLIRQDREPKF